MTPERKREIQSKYARTEKGRATQRRSDAKRSGTEKRKASRRKPLAKLRAHISDCLRRWPGSTRPDFGDPTSYAHLTDPAHPEFGVCGECHRPINPKFSGRAMQGGVIDHRVPPKRGGSPTAFSNLRRVHRFCNAIKAARGA